jgi:hypothetical protein
MHEQRNSRRFEEVRGGSRRFEEVRGGSRRFEDVTFTVTEDRAKPMEFQGSESHLVSPVPGRP